MQKFQNKSVPKALVHTALSMYLFFQAFFEGFGASRVCTQLNNDELVVCVGLSNG